MTAHEASARMEKAKKIARTLLAQAPAARWLEAGIAGGTPEFWLAAAQQANVRSALRGRVPSEETQALVVELVRASAGVAA